ncbi:acid phosphatase [Caulobacter mirabilis]|uniref:Acid phosphatase n=1 Tax=Caulobacter mirabilis TaxID=69666 RepID=A0A2D2AZB4_9CAUL|nr:phosphatase PAP2 family protein [Caulobacter mirabilis]ATQ43335.1 hypothetical protein CSW64_13375 [Caulobacter mirabilis]
MSKTRILLLTAACAGLALPTAGLAASPEWESPAVSHKDVKPYVDPAVIAQPVLAPPPVEGSPEDADDVAAVMRRQAATDAARWKIAGDDADWLYDRFAEVVGAPLTRDRAPITVNMLNRVMRQVGRPVFDAKDVYKRARPYQRLQLSRVCGKGSAPAPDPDAAKRTSYPSGHSAYGWATALMLAQAAPEKAGAILERGRQYGESRIICGMHFPSDIEAGRLVATTVVSRLAASPAFRTDLACAKAELAGAAPSSECAKLAAALKAAPPKP